jgi:hypothetical protein
MIKKYRDSISIKVQFEKDGKIVAHIQDQFETLFNDVTTNSRLINGKCFGNLSLPETEGFPTT